MIYTDPPDTFIDKVLENRSSRESFHNIFTSPKDLLSADLNEQIALSQQEHAMFVATGDDPWIEIPVSLEAETVRYCLITMACKVQSDHAEAQLFWSGEDRKSTRLNSSHSQISYAVFCLKKKKKLDT